MKYNSKIFFTIRILIIILFLSACNKDKAKTIDVTFLLNHYYMDYNKYETIVNGELKNYDSVKLSFEIDTFKVFQYYIINNFIKIDTGIKKYYIYDNKIAFGFFLTNESNKYGYGPAANIWEILTLNKDTMIVDRLSSDGSLLGHFGFKTKNKM